MVGVHVKQIFVSLGNILNQYFTSIQSSYSRPTWNGPSEQTRPTWNGLTDVAVRKIFGQLKAEDRARLMVVSKTWKRILCRDDLPIVPELWRLFMYSCLPNVRLFDTSEGSRCYSFKVPEFYEDFPKCWICGSSSGWLVLARGPKMEPDMVLWNPLNGDVMVLPRLSTLPFLPQLLKSGPEVYNISSYIKRVHVSSSPECIVAVVFWDPDDDRKRDYLTLCTPTDREWKVFQGDYFHSLSDILFHDGKLYALAKEIMDDTYKKNTKFKKKICLSKCQVEICVLCFDYKADDALGDGNFYRDEDIASNPMFNITRGDKISKHLVEFSGQLLVIDVVFDLFAYNSNGEGPVKTFRCHTIQRLEVRKVDGLEMVESLGDDLIIALSDLGSLTVPPSAIYRAGEHDSGIIFTNQYARGIVGDHDSDADKCVACGSGVFHLETKQFLEYDVKYYKHPGWFISGWHTPKLF